MLVLLQSIEQFLQIVQFNFFNMVVVWNLVKNLDVMDKGHLRQYLKIRRTVDGWRNKFRCLKWPDSVSYFTKWLTFLYFFQNFTFPCSMKTLFSQNVFLKIEILFKRGRFAEWRLATNLHLVFFILFNRRSFQK